MDWDNNAGLSN